MRIRYPFENINLLNILLIAAVAVMAHYTILPLLNINVKLKSLVPPQAKTAGEKAPQPEYQIPSPADYLIISEQNLFHPERRVPPEKKEEAPLPKPEFVLYGTLITDTTSVAYLEDLKAPRNTTGRGQRQVALKKGDALSGFTLKEIEPDKIVMVRGEEKMVVPIFDAQRPKTRSYTPTVSKGAPDATHAAPVPPRAQGLRERGAGPADSLNKRESPRTRAPLKPADERTRQFFTK